MLRFRKESADHLGLFCLSCGSSSEDLEFVGSRLAGTWVICTVCGRGEQIYRMASLCNEATPSQVIATMVPDTEVQYEELREFENFDIKLRSARNQVKKALSSWMKEVPPDLASQIFPSSGLNPNDEFLRKRLSRLFGSIRLGRNSFLVSPVYLLPDFPIGFLCLSPKWPHSIAWQYRGFFDPVTSGFCWDLSHIRDGIYIFDDFFSFFETCVSFVRGGFGTGGLMCVCRTPHTALGQEAIWMVRSLKPRKVLVSRSSSEDELSELASLLGADYVRISSTSISRLISNLGPSGFLAMINARAIPARTGRKVGQGSALELKSSPSMIRIGSMTLVQSGGAMVEVGHLGLIPEVIEDRGSNRTYFGRVLAPGNREGIFSVSRRDLERDSEWVARLHDRFQVRIDQRFFSASTLIDFFERTRVPVLAERRFGWHEDAGVILTPGMILSRSGAEVFKSWRLWVPMSSTHIFAERSPLPGRAVSRLRSSLDENSVYLTASAVAAIVCKALFVSPFHVRIRSDGVEELEKVFEACSIPVGHKLPGWPVQVSGGSYLLIKSDEVGTPAELVELSISDVDLERLTGWMPMALDLCLEEVARRVVFGRRISYSLWTSVLDIVASFFNRHGLLEARISASSRSS